MRIIVLGAGVIGLSTAWALADDGHDVEVIERAERPATGASFANGGQLSYSFVTPLAGPRLLPRVPSMLFSADSPLRIRRWYDRDFISWGSQFVKACNSTAVSETTRQLLALSYYSRSVMQRFVEDDGMEFDYAEAGKLIVYSDEDSLADAQLQCRLQRDLGVQQEILDPAACLTCEPALAAIRDRILGGLYTPTDAVGDCRKFCEELASNLLRRSANCKLTYGSEVVGFISSRAGIIGVETGGGRCYADAVVLALGTESRKLSKLLGFDLPIYPLKGYSLTLDLVSQSVAPNVSITDSSRKVVYARIGNRLRAAGMLDFDGYDCGVDGARANLLVRNALATFPKGGDFSQVNAWAGLRPGTPRGTPILGPSPVSGLFLNVGHGALGFTLAAGSGRAVADLIQGCEPAIPLHGLTL